MKLKKILNSKRFRYGGVATVITAIALVLMVLINMLAGMLSDKFPLTVDLTPNQAFNLSQESVDFVKGVGSPVKISVLVDKAKLENRGGYYGQVMNIIDQYPKFNSHVSVEYIDLTKNPGFASQYADLNLQEMDIVVESGGRVRTTAINDLFNTSMNQYTYQTVIRSSKAEQELTAAIMAVTTGADVKVIILTGHDEMETDYLEDLLQKNGFTVIKQNLSTEELDPEAKVVVMMAPKRDPDVEMLKKLDDFLTNGREFGKTLLYAPPVDVVSTPNLDAFLAQWGVKVGSNLIQDTDQNNVMPGYPYHCLVEFTSEDYTEKMATQTLVLSMAGRELSTLFDSQSGYETTALLSYFGTSTLLQPENAEPSAAKTQAYPALLRSTFTQYEGTTQKSSQVLVAASSTSFDWLALQSQSFANAEYYLAVLNTLTDRKDVITIAPKDLNRAELGLTQQQYLNLGLIFMLLIPILVAAAGIVVWLRRRHK